MVAFGPVLGFLLGAYLISYYVDALFVDTSIMQASESVQKIFFFSVVIIIGVFVILDRREFHVISILLLKHRVIRMCDRGAIILVKMCDRGNDPCKFAIELLECVIN